METINCSIIKDLLPLYADGVLSEETTHLLQEHLQNCSDCRQEYDTLTKTLHLPAAANIQAEKAHALKNFRQRQQRQKYRTILVTALVTAFLFIAAGLSYTHVGAIHDYFSPEITVTLRHIQTNEHWQTLTVGKNGCLNFDRPFYGKAVALDANSDAPAMLRIRDTTGHIIIDDFTVCPGSSASLGALKNGTDYVVEIKVNADFMLIRFL